MKSLQTDRTLHAYNEGRAPEVNPRLAEVSKIERFARRIAKPLTVDDQVRRALSTQHAILTFEKQIRDLGAVPVSGHIYLQAAKAASAAQAKSTTCETKSAPQPEVGRNSPCPCGSNKKYKRCCGVNAPPILNQAA